MKFAAGGSLQEARASRFRNDPRRCVTLMAKIARAVQYAHSQGILHRDLKPGNILLDGRGEPLVSDFGLAKWLDTTSDLTRTLTIFGTPGYIAPEQAQAVAARSHTRSRCLQSRRDPVRSARRPTAVPGRTRALGYQASRRKTGAETALSRADSPTAIWKPSVPAVSNANRKRVIAPPAIWPKTWNAGSKADRSSRVPSRRRCASWRWSKRNPKLSGFIGGNCVLGGAGMAATITSSRLSSIVQRTEIARHSVVLTPFEDLGDLSTTSQQAREATNAFTAAFDKGRRNSCKLLGGKVSGR